MASHREVGAASCFLEAAVEVVVTSVHGSGIAFVFYITMAIFSQSIDVTSENGNIGFAVIIWLAEQKMIKMKFTPWNRNYEAVPGAFW